MGKDHPAWLGKAMQSGGRAWSGEGDSGKALKERADALRSDSARLGTESKKEAAGQGATLGLGAAGMMGARSKIGKLIGSGLASYGATELPATAKRAVASDRMRKEALEASAAGDAAEGRKRGGRATKRKSK